MSESRTIVVEFVAGPLDGWASEQTTNASLTLPEALHAEGGFYVLEMHLGQGASGRQHHAYVYRWHEGEAP